MGSGIINKRSASNFHSVVQGKHDSKKLATLFSGSIGAQKIVGRGKIPETSHHSHQVEEDRAAEVVGKGIRGFPPHGEKGDQSTRAAGGATSQNAWETELFMHSVGGGPGVGEGLEDTHGGVGS